MSDPSPFDVFSEPVYFPGLDYLEVHSEGGPTYSVQLSPNLVLLCGVGTGKVVGVKVFNVKQAVEGKP